MHTYRAVSFLLCGAISIGSCACVAAAGESLPKNPDREKKYGLTNDSPVVLRVCFDDPPCEARWRQASPSSCHPSTFRTRIAQTRIAIERYLREEISAKTNLSLVGFDSCFKFGAQSSQLRILLRDRNKGDFEHEGKAWRQRGLTRRIKLGPLHFPDKIQLFVGRGKVTNRCDTSQQNRRSCTCQDLGSSCFKQLVLHEMLHALGFAHDEASTVVTQHQTPIHKFGRAKACAEAKNLSPIAHVTGLRNGKSAFRRDLCPPHRQSVMWSCMDGDMSHRSSKLSECQRDIINIAMFPTSPRQKAYGSDFEARLQKLKREAPYYR